MNRADFDAARDAWDALVDAMDYPNPMCSWAWMSSAQDHLAPEAAPMLLAVYDGAELRAVLPLARAAGTRTHGWLDHGCLAWLGGQASGADHHDLIAAPEHIDASLQAVGDFLAAGAARWGMMRVPLMTHESKLLAWMRSGAGHGWRARVRRVTCAPWLALPANMDQFVKSLSGKDRDKFRWKRRQRMQQALEAEGFVYHAYARAQFDDALGALFALHHGRARAKSIASALARSGVEAFHHALVQRMPEEQVVLRGLVRGDEVIAVLYGFVLGRRLFFFNSGFDQGWAHAGPGQVIMTQLMSEMMETGKIEFNFLQGDEIYKMAWTHDARELFDASLYSPGWHGMVLHAVDRFGDALRGRMRHAQAAAAPARAAGADHGA